MTFLGWLSDLLERLSDLQLGDEKGTLNHLVGVLCRCFVNHPPHKKKTHARWETSPSNEDIFFFLRIFGGGLLTGPTLFVGFLSIKGSWRESLKG